MNEQIKKQILVIDDSEDIREIVSRSLKGTEFHVICAVNGREGIQLAKDRKPDLILLDIVMPQFDGIMAGKILKRNQTTKDIPIIFLTAKKTKEDIAAAMQVGGSDYIIKPFSPKELLTRIRKILNTLEAKKTIKQSDSKTIDSNNTEVRATQSIEEIICNKIQKYDDIIVCTDINPYIVMDTWKIYHGLFSNIISDGIFKIVLDFHTIEKIDGSGLALLISVDQAVQNYRGQLVLTYPSKEINNRFSFIKINDLFRCYNTVHDAIDFFKSKDLSSGESISERNICLSCSYINEDDIRYCGFCGTNLIVGRGKNIFDYLKRSISKKLFLEKNGGNGIEKITKKEVNLEHEIPTQFFVEVYDKNIIISYRSNRTFLNDFAEKKQIGIEIPTYRAKYIELQQGTSVRLKVAKFGANLVYETKIERFDKIKKMIFVHYDKDAMAMHIQKNFSVVPKLPISIEFTAPSFEHTGEVVTGKILEMSRVRLVVFAEDQIPENECLGIYFVLPDSTKISSPLVIAQKRKDRFMYDVEFVVIDEKDRSKMIQYMYKRQIEMAKLESD